MANIAPLDEREREIIRTALYELRRRPELFEGYCTKAELSDLLERLPIQPDYTIRVFTNEPARG